MRVGKFFINFGLQWNVSFNKYRMAALETYQHGSKIYIFFKLLKYIHVQHISQTYEQSSEYDLDCRVLLCLSLAYTTYWSRMLLLWLFKANREYDGVQRLDLTSTQGQTLVFIFTVIFTIILPWLWQLLYSTYRYEAEYPLGLGTTRQRSVGKGAAENIYEIVYHPILHNRVELSPEYEPHHSIHVMKITAWFFMLQLRYFVLSHCLIESIMEKCHKQQAFCLSFIFENTITKKKKEKRNEIYKKLPKINIVLKTYRTK